MMGRNRISQLIQKSSLGQPDVLRVRARTPSRLVDAVLTHSELISRVTSTRETHISSSNNSSATAPAPRGGPKDD